jgi:hypothetical protein
MKSAEEIGRAILKRFAAQAAVNRAAGDRLRARVRAVLDQHPSQRMTAKMVIKYLAREPDERIPSVRRVQEVLKELRAVGNFTMTR